MAADGQGDKGKKTLHVGGRTSLQEHDEKLFQWFRELRDKGVSVKNVDLQDEARKIAKKHGIVLKVCKKRSWFQLFCSLEKFFLVFQKQGKTSYFLLPPK